MAELLDPLRVPLSGSHLIEASAGTGKTWTIAALFLRLVLGHGGSAAFARPLVPAEILVMTFTVAATRELSDRIRARLSEAARCFRGERQPADGDDFLRGLIADHGDGPARTAAAWRLAAAADAMDDAAVHTIDAWCQRMLREHAVDSGSLFDEELLVDENAHVDDAARDYWRRNVYPLEGPALARVLDVWPDAEALRKEVRELLRLDVGAVDSDRSLDETRLALEAEVATTLQRLKPAWVKRSTEMAAWFEATFDRQPMPLNRTKLKPERAAQSCRALHDWATSPDLERPVPKSIAWERLSPEGLRDACRGGQRIDVPAWSAELGGLCRELDELPDTAGAMRRHAAASVRDRVAEIKRHAGTPGFRDLLERLDAALAGPNGERLRSRIVEQFPAALIDEFQDTSPLQYRVFDRVYRPRENDPSTVLFLIGDPKQSIFAFRGADIRSYLAASLATAGRHRRLGTNHRSTHAVVAAVNRLFERAESRPGAGAFMFRDAFAPAGSPLPFVPVEAHGRDERLVTVAGIVPALLVCHDDSTLNKDGMLRRFAALASEHIVAMLNDAAAGFHRADAANVRLRPADIAVLVRNRHEAKAIRDALGLRGLASVYLSESDSVFGGAEAPDLVRWLTAVSSPLDSRRVRAAFATPLIGLSLDDLAELAHDDTVFERRVDLMRQLKAVWARQGVLPMLRQALHALDLPARWLAEAGGERKLTNVLHLAELLQAASADLEGEETLIRWLDAQVAAATLGDEESLVRLESEADLVKVVTTFKAKGLEYPFVYLPFAATLRTEGVNKLGFLALPGDGESRAVTFQPTDVEKDAADHERHREDLRLLYVALTRARHALWVGVAAPGVRKDGSSDLHRTAIGYLVSGELPVSPAAFRARLVEVLEGVGSVVAVPDSDPAVTPWEGEPALPDIIERPAYAACFETDWTIGSFSGLVRDLSALPAAAGSIDPSLEEELRAAADLVEPPAAPGTRAPRHRFPRGALPGNFLHDQLQWLAETGFALADPQLADRLRRRCERAGWGQRADDVVTWLGEVVSTPLPPLGATLVELRTTLPEMEFWFPASDVAASRIDALCGTHILPGRPRPPLARRTLNGMVMGFMDLVFEHGGRYWVLDYKSNALGDDDAAYGHEALEGAMVKHRYDVQAAIYLLALHRLLRQRLGARYRPAQQLGGALYLFLRGIEGPERGCLHVAPSADLLDGLDAALGQPSAAEIAS